MRSAFARGDRPLDGIAVGVAVFLSGGVLLGVELAASRVLAPFFGNSLFVWGALIGVVLAGLSIGYWVGGALADRLPVQPLLAAVIAGGGLLVAAIPLLDEPILEAVVSWDPGPRLNPLVAAIALFGGPSVLLAAVTPIAVRLRARTLEGVGGTAGRLFSLSTAGSITGTFATAFFLIPEVGTDELLGLMAATLFAAVAVLSLSERRLLVVAASLAVAAGASFAAFASAPQAGRTIEGVATQNWSPLYRLHGYGYLDPRDPAGTIERDDFKLVFADDTRYHRLSVVDDASTRYLRFDNSLQSAMYLDDPFRTRFRYTDFFHLGFAYNPGAKRILFIGLGAGSSPKLMWRNFDDVRIEVVELDPVVVDVGYRYFDVPRDPRLHVTVEDGRRYLVKNRDRWDVIVIDAFFADAIPFHLVTREFLELARSRLAPDGVIVTNAIGTLSRGGSQLFRSIYRTYRTVFPTVLVHPVNLGNRDAFQNLILVATENAAPQPTVLAGRWRELRARVPGVPDLRKPILERHDSPVPIRDVPTLTDNYAPTDALLLLFQ